MIIKHRAFLIKLSFTSEQIGETWPGQNQHMSLDKNQYSENDWQQLAVNVHSVRLQTSVCPGSGTIQRFHRLLCSVWKSPTEFVIY